MIDKRKIDFVLPVLFLAILVLPFVNSSFGIWKFEQKSENRSFKESVDFDLKRLDYFPNDFEEYYNDNFSFRAPLLDFYHDLKFYQFKVSPHPDKTIVGKDNWYFVAGHEKEIVEGKRDFSEDTLKLFLKEWQYRRKYLEKKNIKSYWIIAPCKHHVYPEYLPFKIHISKTRRIEKLKQYFTPSLGDLIIDPVSELKSNKDSLKVFYQLDNHWNFRAGYLTTRLLLDRIKEDFPNANLDNMPLVEWKDTTVFDGIHYFVLGIDNLSEVKQLPIIQNPQFETAELYGFPPVPGFAYPWDHEKRFVNKKAKTKLRILFIRDSFGEQVIPFVREIFSESVFIFDAWQYKLNEEIIETVKPDIVVFLGLETHVKATLNFPANKEKI